MKELSVTRLNATAVAAADIPALMDEAGVEFQKIDSLNWSDWPYRPAAAFRIAHTGDAILLHYVVSEEAVRAVAPEDNGRVWEDSCVEFFVSPAADGVYYNVECNCAGQLLIGGGKERAGRSHAPRQVLGSVDRWASLGRAPFDTRAGQQTWQVALRVPVSALFMHGATLLDGRTMRANFYKCGDLLPRPHFLSWNAISLPRPDFHCPEFFGTLRFM